MRRPTTFKVWVEIEACGADGDAIGEIVGEPVKLREFRTAREAVEWVGKLEAAHAPDLWRDLRADEVAS